MVPISQTNGISRYKENFIKLSRNELAYILGLVVTDGCININAKNRLY